MNFDEAKSKAKYKLIQGKNWVVRKAKEAKDWVVKHPDEVSVFATAVTVVTTAGLRRWIIIKSSTNTTSRCGTQVRGFIGN